MEGFTYSNIFDTKGIEYLVIIAFFAILIPFWILLNRRVEIREKVMKLTGILSSGILRIPQGLFFSGSHTWTHLEASGMARIGIDDFLLHATGKVSIRNNISGRDRVKKGEVIALLEQDGKSLKILSPVSGEVVGINRSLEENPDILNIDPYTRGWIIAVKPENWVEETSLYKLGANATKWFESELARLKDFLSVSSSFGSSQMSGVVLQDGGEMVDHPLSRLPENCWGEFESKFLAGP